MQLNWCTLLQCMQVSYLSQTLFLYTSSCVGIKSNAPCNKTIFIQLHLTIIPRARVGYEVTDSQRGTKRRVGYNHLISNKREWNNNYCFIKTHQQVMQDFTDFAWLEQPECNLRDPISRVWYNGSYTIAAKPIQFLIM